MRLAGVAQQTLERLVSTDLVTLQRFVGRDVLNVLKGLLGRNDPLGATTSTPRSGVLDGLRVTIDQALGPPRVIVGEGRCCAVDTTVVEATTQDSQFRLGEQRNGTTSSIDLAAPAGANRIDLVEAVPAYVDVTTESRDIYDNVTGTFTAANVPKQQRPSLTFVVTSAVAAPGVLPFMPAFTAGRVPIAAVFVDSVLGATRVIDLRRLLLASNNAHGVVSGGEMWSGVRGTAATSITIGAFEAWIDGVFVRNSLPRTFTVLSRMDEAAAFTADAFAFVYVYVPAGAYIFDPANGGAYADGIVVIAPIAPDPAGRPSGDLTGGVRPLGNTVAGRSAVCLGAVCVTNTIAGTLRPFLRTQDGWTFQRMLETNILDFAGAPNPASSVVSLGAHPTTGDDLVPVTAEAVDLTARYSNASGGPLSSELAYTPGAVAPPATERWESRFPDLPDGDTRSENIRVPLDNLRQLRIDRTAATAIREQYLVLRYYEPKGRHA